MKMPSKKDAKQLMSLSASEGTGRKLLDAIIEEHSDCISGEFCEICEIADEELRLDIGIELGGNPSLAPEQQSRVFDLLFERDELLAVGVFAENKNLSDELKASVTNVEAYSGNEDAYEEVSEILKSLRANARFTKEDIKTFIKTVNEFWGRTDDWHKD
jgi:hypothetical protein